MPRWTKQELEAYAAKRGFDTERREFQKQETGNSGLKYRIAENPHPRKDQKEDGTNHRRFAVRITFNLSDNRPRDMDGMLATVMDCLQAARRRLVAMDTGTNDVGSKGS
jgi:hypothetical protein